ncbi:hypothetical protein [Arthrobacter sp. Soil782]|nr:hypothetical protein [Arthrobacter sp. Soil782]
MESIITDHAMATDKANTASDETETFRDVRLEEEDVIAEESEYAEAG